MDNFNFCSPTEFIFGKDRETECGEYVKKYSKSKVLIHYGGGSVIRSGLLDKVKRSLTDSGIGFIELGGVQPNPRDTLVYKGIELCRAENVDFILAVGGGSVIDSAKAIAAGVPYDGDFWDFYCGKHVETALPIGVILTIAAAGSEGSGDSVITKEDGLLKRGTGSDVLRAKFSILDPALTQTLPAYQTACGATDIMAHVFERYFTNTKEVEITDCLCEAVLTTMIKETPRVIADPDNYEARANIMWAGMVAHNGLVGVGRSQDWNSHAIEHELSALYDCAHGAGLAVIMPAWMEYVYEHDVERFCRMATKVFGCQMNEKNPKKTALEGIHRFRHFLHDIGMPINFEELGAKEEDIPVMVKKLGLGKGKTGGFVALSSGDITKIYKTAARATLTEQEVITIKDLAFFLIHKEEHYPISDEFIGKYQQKSGGYISFARQTGHPTDLEQCEPNQKWHFFESYLIRSFEDGTIKSWDDDASIIYNNRIPCTEWMLWFLEAVCADDKDDQNYIDIEAARDIAVEGKNKGLTASSIAEEIRQLIPWEIIVKKIKPAHSD